MKEDWKLLPKEMLNYLRRIGVDIEGGGIVSFRRAVIREKVVGGKYGTTERVSISFKDGVIKINGEFSKGLAPTKEELAEIEEAYKKIKLPESVKASKSATLSYIQKQKKNSDDFYLMWDRHDGKVIMIHERIKEGEGKGYVPHTLWNDGEWRKMEPDGALPFWKPEKDTGRGWIMIHEGAKTAKVVSELDYGNHPWGEELGKYEHWGMIGGAINPRRTDWEELKRAKSKRVIYVCDNDVDGKSALQIVSECYNASLVGIMFDSNFPDAWDMADDMPKKFEPKLVNYMKPATWATRRVKGEKGGRPSYELTRDFKKEWVHAAKPEVYVHTDWPSNIYDPVEFNNIIRPFSDVKDTTLIVQQDNSSKSATLDYIPAMAPGIFAGKGKGGIRINTHSPSEIEAVKGDAGPFFEYMERLIPIERDRNELLRWMATLIARPEIKMEYGVLLVSETQGVGKSTIGYILKCLLGEKNVSTPSERDVTDSKFNGWLAFKRLVLIEEIYAGHSSKAYDNLKSLITEPSFKVNEKYRAEYDVTNWAHVLATSNSMRALKLDNSDRRWFVPEVTEEGAHDWKYWKGLRHWLNEENGLGIIKWWASDWLKKNYAVEKGAHAPDSTTKDQMIRENLSEGMELVMNFLQNVIDAMEKESWLRQNTKPAMANGEWKPSGVIILDQHLVDLIKAVIHEDKSVPYLERRITIRKIAKATKRFFISKEKVMIKGRSGSFLCSTKDLTRASWKDLQGYVKPLDVKTLYEGWVKV